jgi:parallel beta-helix repeat protein
MWTRSLLLFCTLLLLTPRASAETYYTGPAGCSDTGPGTQAQPFCSPSKAAAKLKAGDTLRLLAGTYAEQLVIPSSASGTAEKPVVIQGAAGGASVIDGSKLTIDEQGLVQGTGLANLEIKDLKLRASPFYCLRLSKVSAVVLEGLIVDGCKHGGLLVDGPSTKVTIRGCDVKGTDGCGKDCGIHEAITLSNVVGFLVTKNLVHDGVKEGIDAKDGSGEGEISENEVSRMGQVGLYLNHAYRVKVHHNKIHDGGSSGIQISVGDFATGMPETTNCDIYQNEIWNNGTSGIEFWRTFVGEVSSNRVFNNTIVGSKVAGIYVEDARFNTIANNILARNKQNGVFGNTVALNTVTTNLFFQNGAAVGETQWENPIQGDPLFVDEERFDFRLRKGSPAIDQGIYVGLTDSVGVPDLGAHEYKEGQTPEAPGEGGCSIGQLRASGLVPCLLLALAAWFSGWRRRRAARRS